MTTPTPPEYPRTQCTSCKAPIIFAATEHGQKMPLDADPVDPATGGGNVKLVDRTDAGMLPLAVVVKNPANLFGVKHVWRSHFATCPYAARHRRRPAPRREHA